MSGGGPWRRGPEAARPSSDGVDVWRVALDDPGWESAAKLSAPERERAGRLLEGPVRRRWSASRNALRAVLGRYLGGEDALPEEFALQPHGKPTLPGIEPALRFNLSHSEDLALIAVAARGEVGIDVERVDATRDVASLATHGLGREAAAKVLAAAPAERALVFYRAWVRHEAIAKCGGEGLGGGAAAEGIEVSAIEPVEGFVAALATERPQTAPRRFTIGPG
jgi:4'-phosphopantetheinyl transferase